MSDVRRLQEEWARARRNVIEASVVLAELQKEEGRIREELEGLISANAEGESR